MAEKRVTGIGGVFIKCQDPENVKKWYDNHLGLKTDQYGAMFEFRKVSTDEHAYLQWSVFKQDSDYFDPSTKGFMINYRVDNIRGLVDKLKAEGVTVLDEIEEFDYGKFVHILDPEGNKIELWEPVDKVFKEGGYAEHTVHD
ncbi:MAG: VOC family protein [Cyclobacteriaceae bacterium]